ncbi:transposase [Geminicoccus flavidas]|uniref:transposase n=1 Tax=Geminicoccus flavidas TaxID=2506407 RepID=UPI00190F7A37
MARKTKRHPTVLTDEEGRRIESLLPQVPRRGRGPRTDLREVLNAIRYMARSGGGWRMLPKDFPLGHRVLVVPAVCTPALVPH